ncbi:uncharacterized protein A4U43_C10F15450 [Asparagus officinalis]|uniref:Helicase C-terminal domain-containing protein n=1 Tax=Asparagus officinalis TaxID=4686 RepID=A0A5P1E304_ASPOF|nr:uncharacterized protein A4U43_C10F15450 [Asparagus officinalis]
MTNIILRTGMTWFSLHVEIVLPMEKQRRLEQIIRTQERGSKFIIFCSTKRLCDQLAHYMRGYGAAAIHGDKSQGERDYVLNQFRCGKAPILVATDVAARGLDIKDIRTALYGYEPPIKKRKAGGFFSSLCGGSTKKSSKSSKKGSDKKRSSKHIDNTVPIFNLEDIEEGVEGAGFDDEKSLLMSQIGWIYDSVTEDILTGYKMHARGWRSIYCMPHPPAFKGSAPINLSDRLNQVLRWALGSVEILFSRHCPIWYGYGGRLKFLERKPVLKDRYPKYTETSPKQNSTDIRRDKAEKAEVDFLGTVSHPNLVKLLGYCCEARGSLENRLFRSFSPLIHAGYINRRKRSPSACLVSLAKVKKSTEQSSSISSEVSKTCLLECLQYFSSPVLLGNHHAMPTLGWTQSPFIDPSFVNSPESSLAKNSFRLEILRCAS